VHGLREQRGVERWGKAQKPQMSMELKYRASAGSNA